MSIDENSYTKKLGILSTFKTYSLIPQAAIHESAGLALPLNEQNSF